MMICRQFGRLHLQAWSKTSLQTQKPVFQRYDVFCHTSSGRADLAQGEETSSHQYVVASHITGNNMASLHHQQVHAQPDTESIAPAASEDSEKVFDDVVVEEVSEMTEEEAESLKLLNSATSQLELKKRFVRLTRNHAISLIVMRDEDGSYTSLQEAADRNSLPVSKLLNLKRNKMSSIEMLPNMFLTCGHRAEDNLGFPKRIVSTYRASSKGGNHVYWVVGDTQQNRILDWGKFPVFVAQTEEDRKVEKMKFSMLSTLDYIARDHAKLLKEQTDGDLFLKLSYVPRLPLIEIFILPLVRLSVYDSLLFSMLHDPNNNVGIVKPSRGVEVKDAVLKLCMPEYGKMDISKSMHIAVEKILQVPTELSQIMLSDSEKQLAKEDPVIANTLMHSFGPMQKSLLNDIVLPSAERKLAEEYPTVEDLTHRAVCILMLTSFMHHVRSGCVDESIDDGTVTSDGVESAEAMV